MTLLENLKLHLGKKRKSGDINEKNTRPINIHFFTEEPKSIEEVMDQIIFTKILGKQDFITKDYGASIEFTYSGIKDKIIAEANNEEIKLYRENLCKILSARYDIKTKKARWYLSHTCLEHGSWLCNWDNYKNKCYACEHPEGLEIKNADDQDKAWWDGGYTPELEIILCKIIPAIYSLMPKYEQEIKEMTKEALVNKIEEK